jgi:hypothetical protein
MPERKRCAFCQRDDRKISNEHAWPNWIRNYLPITKDFTVEMHRYGKDSNRWTPRDDMGVTVNDICKTCNEGWMENELEKPVQRFLHHMIRDGKPTTLDVNQIMNLVSWAYKTMMVFDLLNPKGDRTFTAKERLAFSKHPRPNVAGLVAWFSSYAGSMLTTATATRLNFSDSKAMLNATAATFSIGYVTFQLLVYEPNAFPPLGIWIPDLQIPGNWVVRLWPLDAQTLNRQPIWPPSVRLNDDRMIHFRNTWKRPIGQDITGIVAQE